MKEVLLLCQCDSFSCPKYIMLPDSVDKDILARRNVYIIVDGCETGPNPNDKLVEKRAGYALYAES